MFQLILIQPVPTCTTVFYFSRSLKLRTLFVCDQKPEARFQTILYRVFLRLRSGNRGVHCIEQRTLIVLNQIHYL